MIIATTVHIGKLHVLILHFPIALAVAAVAADVLWLATKRGFFKDAGLYCLIGAAIFAPPTVLTGSLLADESHPPADLADLAEDHEHAGFATLGIVVGALAVRLIWMKKPEVQWLGALYGVLMAALLVSISITGHLGGKLAFGQDYLSSIFGG